MNLLARIFNPCLLIRADAFIFLSTFRDYL
jgi:hypothetical protein